MRSVYLKGLPSEKIIPGQTHGLLSCSRGVSLAVIDKKVVEWAKSMRKGQSNPSAPDRRNIVPGRGAQPDDRRRCRPRPSPNGVSSPWTRRGRRFRNRKFPPEFDRRPMALDVRSLRPTAAGISIPLLGYGIDEPRPDLAHLAGRGEEAGGQRSVVGPLPPEAASPGPATPRRVMSFWKRSWPTWLFADLSRPELVLSPADGPKDVETPLSGESRARAATGHLRDARPVPRYLDRGAAQRPVDDAFGIRQISSGSASIRPTAGDGFYHVCGPVDAQPLPGEPRAGLCSRRFGRRYSIQAVEHGAVVVRWSRSPSRGRRGDHDEQRQRLHLDRGDSGALSTVHQWPHYRPEEKHVVLNPTPSKASPDEVVKLFSGRDLGGLLTPSIRPTGQTVPGSTPRGRRFLFHRPVHPDPVSGTKDGRRLGSAAGLRASGEKSGPNDPRPMGEIDGERLIMAKIKRIGIMTGGGGALIERRHPGGGQESVVRCEWEVIGIEDGYEGMISGFPETYGLRCLGDFSPGRNDPGTSNTSDPYALHRPNAGKRRSAATSPPKPSAMSGTRGWTPWFSSGATGRSIRLSFFPKRGFGSVCRKRSITIWAERT